jgi:hypothetical protein
MSPRAIGRTRVTEDRRPKHREHPYRSGPSKAWLKIKNPATPGVLSFQVDEP